MTDHRESVSPWAVRGLYFFAFVLVFWPVADLVTNTWPPQFGSVQWRYGFMGLLAGYLHTPVLGIILALVLAYAMNHRRTLRSLSAISLVGAAGLFAVLLLFLLDVLQISGSVPAEQAASFRAGALIAELKHFTSLLALFMLGVGGWKSAGPKPAPRRGEPLPNVRVKMDQGVQP
jgi:hypothetical protein